MQSIPSIRQGDNTQSLPNIESASLKRAQLKVLQRYPLGEFRKQAALEKQNPHRNAVTAHATKTTTFNQRTYL
jgi:hypothetical protein